MVRSLTRAEVRDVDRRAIAEFGLPGVVLMENAARNAVDLLLRELSPAGPILICCGKGNNAGDGFAMARHLDNHGGDVTVLLASPAHGLSGDAAVNYGVIARSGLAIEDLTACSTEEWDRRLAASPSAVIVDALLGTGLQGGVREPFATAIAAINRRGAPVFAVDIPSGLDCDAGQPLGCAIAATLTGTFVARKIGFDQPGAERWTGAVHVLDIGVPRALLQSL